MINTGNIDNQNNVTLSDTHLWIKQYGTFSSDIDIYPTCLMHTVVRFCTTDIEHMHPAKNQQWNDAINII